MGTAISPAAGMETIPKLADGPKQEKETQSRQGFCICFWSSQHLKLIKKAICKLFLLFAAKGLGSWLDTCQQAHRIKRAEQKGFFFFPLSSCNSTLMTLLELGGKFWRCVLVERGNGVCKL